MCVFQFRICYRQQEVGRQILERAAVDVLYPIRRNREFGDDDKTEAVTDESNEDVTDDQMVGATA